MKMTRHLASHLLYIVWEPCQVETYTRKHTGDIQGSLTEVRRIIAALVAQRDARRDEFAQVIAQAMGESIGDAAEAQKFLIKRGISRRLIKQSITQLSEAGKPFTLWTLVDALTRLTQQVQYAGDRTDADRTVSQLLALAA